ncbi:iron ABC transporter permease [Arcobacter suis]|uniref:Iron(III)/spermidine/putrescine ABC transporter, permease protein n=1 Tax=Arcobacter suis CECT 7833 TaxID=663365 RepID=A0AAD0WRT5_9BACT|nr:iron ABC transporter permease [Arcobacter suis]AXX90687.1 iron(III)/spermidine/putrescine ABC transporter, permease protein [Arcobacter suis CECT 7833]RWS45801.1 iron ABC transporter permease [Arcobacter suis]
MEINKLKYSIAPIIGLCIALPILSLLLYFVLNGDFNFEFLFSDIVKGYISNTTILVLGTFAFVVILGTISSYLSARFEYFGDKIFAVLFVLPLAYPAYILGYTYVGFFEYRGILSDIIGDINTRYDILNMSGAIFIFGIAMFPYVYILARVSFGSISSTVSELVSLHKINPIKAFFKVYLPLAYPAIFAGSILAIMETLSDYGTVLYFGIETFSVGIFKSWFGYGDLIQSIYVAIALLIFVFAILWTESLIRKKYRFVSSTFSGKKAPKIKLEGKYNFIAFLISFLIATITLFIPTMVLIYWFILDIHTLDFTTFDYLYNTLSLNIFSSVVIISLSFIVVYMLRFYPSKIGAITHKLSILGYSIPGAVVGVGLLIISSFVDTSLGHVLFGGTFFILIFAYTTRYFASSIGSIENGFSKIDASIDDATKIFGKSESNNIFKVYLPLMKPYILSGFLILYIDIAKELPATLILRPFNYDTLAIRIYELASNEILYKVGFPGLVLVGTTAIAVILLNSKFVRRKI